MGGGGIGVGGKKVVSGDAAPPPSIAVLQQQEDQLQRLLQFAQQFPTEFGEHVSLQRNLHEFQKGATNKQRLTVEQQLILHTFYYNKLQPQHELLLAAPVESKASEEGEQP